MHSQGSQNADNLVYTRENLIGSSFFSMTRSLNCRFHLDFSASVFGKNQSLSIRQVTLGELVSNTLLSNSRSVILSVMQVQANRDLFTLISENPWSSKKTGRHRWITYHHICHSRKGLHATASDCIAFKTSLPQRVFHTTTVEFGNSRFDATGLPRSNG